MKIIALLASHNRIEQTLACLASYFDQAVADDIELRAVLVDDGSSDGTSEAVRDRYPDVEIVHGTGNLFWARAMALAEEIALRGRPDHLFWLNDDVVLDVDALTRLSAASRAGGECIAVGALRDPANGALTYSGVRRRGRHPLRFDLVTPAETPVKVETFNGNAVLVPVSVAGRLGGIDGVFGHGAADFDYGLRAHRAGVKCLLASGTVGVCARLGDRKPWLDTTLTVPQRLHMLFGPKGAPPRARARYLRRHGGVAWPVYWLAPYVKALPALVRAPRGGRLS